MPLTFATWNINSVRLRRPMIEEFLTVFKPDVLCLQEIKCTNEQFPEAEFAAAGYPFQAVNGQKAYHGVATISRMPLTHIEARRFCEIEDSRHVSAQIDYGRGPVTIHNFYVPAGGDEADPETNPKFKHKLGFLAEMQDWFDSKDFASSQLIAGDFNIAPHENDVWSHKQLLKVVSHTPVETEALERLQSRRNWVDLVRKHIPHENKLYSWWSYRAKDWDASDRGRRLDHIWSTPDVAAHSISSDVIRPARGWTEKPSDHVPVITRIA